MTGLTRGGGRRRVTAMNGIGGDEEDGGEEIDTSAT
jgi:hypothetical protein